MIKIKIMVAGGEKTGKTRTCEYFRKNKQKTYVPTIGVDLLTYEHERNIKYTIWDCSGCRVYMPVVQKFMNDANILLLLYSNETDLAYAKQLKSFFMVSDSLTVLVCTNKEKCDIGFEFAQHHNIEFKYLQLTDRSIGDFWKNIYLMCEEKILSDNWLSAKNSLLPYVRSQRYYWCFGWGR
jgi:small GTP-binding protein